MTHKSKNFWKIENETVKNLILFIAVVFISYIAIVSSSIILGLINTIRLLLINPHIEINPDIENLRRTAVDLINTSNPWHLINEVLRGVLIIYLIKIVNRIVNKSEISIFELGFRLEIKQFANLAMGIALMSILFLSALLKDVGRHELSNSLIVTFYQNGIVLLILRAIANAFWQEVVFRGYFQKRLMSSYGILAGIVITSFLFTTMHSLPRGVNFVEILLGTVLFTLIGVIYFLTNSIIYATAIHATGNFYLRSFANNGLYLPEQRYRLAVFSLALVVIMVVNRKILFARNDSGRKP